MRRKSRTLPSSSIEECKAGPIEGRFSALGWLDSGILEKGLPHRDDIPGFYDKRGFVVAPRHAFGIALDHSLAPLFETFDRYIGGIRNFCVATRHSYGLQQCDFIASLNIVGTGLLDLAENGKEFFSIGANGEGDLGIFQKAVAVADFDQLYGFADRRAFDSDPSDQRKNGLSIAGDSDDGIQLGLLKYAEVQQIIGSEFIFV